MMLTKRMFPGLLLACSLGAVAVACSEEQKPRAPIEDEDAGFEWDDEDEFDEEEETTGRRMNDASTRRPDAGDAGRDGGPDGGRGRAGDMDAETEREPETNDGEQGGGSDLPDGPTVVDVDRNADAGDQGGGGNTTVRATPSAECDSVMVRTAGGADRTLEGCCMPSGTCGLISLVLNPGACSTYPDIQASAMREGAMLELPEAKDCTP